jgi:hypothetical protein
MIRSGRDIASRRNRTGSILAGHDDLAVLGHPIGLRQPAVQVSMNRDDLLGAEKVARSDPIPVRLKGAFSLHMGQREALPTGTLPIGIELAANRPLDVGGQGLLALDLVRVVRVHRTQEPRERFA